MAASDYDELLTPYQRVREEQLGQRALEAQMAFDAARAGSSQSVARERELVPTAAAPVEQTAVVPAPPPQPNPFVRPPVPLAAMPLEQQLAWQDREDAKRKEQAALE